MYGQPNTYLPIVPNFLGFRPFSQEIVLPPNFRLVIEVSGQRRQYLCQPLFSRRPDKVTNKKRSLPSGYNRNSAHTLPPVCL